MPASGPAKSGTVSASTGRLEVGEAGRVAVGVEHQCVDLRRGALDDVPQDRPAAERAQAFVAAAHAPRQAAGEQKAGDPRGSHQTSPPLLGPMQLQAAEPDRATRSGMPIRTPISLRCVVGFT